MLDLGFEGRGGTALKCFGCVYMDCGIKRSKSEQKTQIFTCSDKTRGYEGRRFGFLEAKNILEGFLLENRS